LQIHEKEKEKESDPVILLLLTINFELKKKTIKDSNINHDGEFYPLNKLFPRKEPINIARVVVFQL
jgi:hypothetical protein